MDCNFSSISWFSFTQQSIIKIMFTRWELGIRINNHLLAKDKKINNKNKF